MPARPKRHTHQGPFVAVQLAPTALVQAAWQSFPETRARPLAIARDTGALLAVSDEARGVQPGQTRAQARLLCPDLVVLPPDPVAASTLYEDLLALLTAFSPIAEATDPLHGCCTLDARGCAALWGCREEEWTGAPLAEGVRAAARAQGLAVKAGYGGTPFGARLVCATGTAAPVDALPLGHAVCGLPAVTVAALADLGIRTAGDLLRLSHAAVVERCGPGAGALHRQLAREEPPPLRVWTPPPTKTVASSEVACATTQALDALTHELCRDLHHALAGEAVGTLTLRLTVDDSSVRSSSSDHHLPLSTVSSLHHAVTALSAACPVEAVVTAVQIRAAGLARPHARQEGLWAVEADRKRDRLARVLAAHSRRTGTPLARRWTPDPLSLDGWTYDDAGL